MLIAKVVYGVKGHMQTRWFEWLLTALILNFGLTLLRPEANFLSSHRYDVMARFGPENLWGYGLTAIGAARFAALFINGTFESFRILSPYVRSAGAGLSAFAWFAISFGIYASGNVTPDAGTYALIMIAEIIVCWIVAQQGGTAEKAYRDGRAHP